ncbi:MAG: histidine kinase [Epsilonproteobacteria bacterium]|nr:MAG: histidine kinase [Campylobacterota bacterium]
MHRLLIYVLFFPLFLSATQTLESVTLQLQWKHQFEFAGFYAAKEKGYYADAGLDVTFVEYSDQNRPIDAVLGGQAQYGVSYSNIISEYMQGKPLVFLANFFKRSPLAIVAQPYIKTPQDLVGKKVMGISEEMDNIMRLMMMDKFQVDSKKFIRVAPSFSTVSFVNKEVDAMSIFVTNEIYELMGKGVDYNIFNPSVYGAEFYDVNLFTSKSELVTHPLRVKRFREASIKGWEYALSHQSEIIALIQKKYNSLQKSTEALQFEATQIVQLMMPKVYDIGFIDKQRVQMMADDFIELGVLDQKSRMNFDQFIYQDVTKDLLFSEEEQQYIAEKGQITYCVDPNWMPLEKIDKGCYIGIGADYMQEISQKINIPFTLIPTVSWAQSIAYAKARKCDIFPVIMQTDERRTYLNFTEPYLSFPAVIATTFDKFFIADLNTVIDKRFGVVKGYAYIDILKQRYPRINLIEVDSIEDGLHKTATGELYGYIDSLAAIGYKIKKHYMDTMKITGCIDQGRGHGIGVRNDDLLLFSILQKSLNSIDERRKQSIADQWINVEYVQAIGFWKYGKYLAAVLVLLLVLVYRNFYLTKQKNRLQLAHNKIERLNRTLDQRVKEEVSKNYEREKTLFQQSRLAQMGEMISMIAHQWRQPLGAISTTTIAIETKMKLGKFDWQSHDGRVKAEAYLFERLKKINLYLEALTTTIDDFRNFYKADKKREILSIIVPIQNTLRIIEINLSNKGIRLECACRKGTPLLLFSNELTQVLLNILKNAEDNFSLKTVKSPYIRIATFEDEHVACIEISDNGGGIDPAIIDRIFDPYFSTKLEKNGTGLGLYMSKMIIEDHHHGTLKASNRDGGAVFRICMPLKER